MDGIRPIALRGKTGIRLYQPILPNRWQGETNCLVGPFSGKEVAEYFAGYACDFGQFEKLTFRVFAKRDAWYVEIGNVECPYLTPLAGSQARLEDA